MKPWLRYFLVALFGLWAIAVYSKDTWLRVTAYQRLKKERIELYSTEDSARIASHEEAMHLVAKAIRHNSAMLLMLVTMSILSHKAYQAASHKNRTLKEEKKMIEEEQKEARNKVAERDIARLDANRERIYQEARESGYFWKVWAIELIDRYQLMERTDMSLADKARLYSFIAPGEEWMAIDIIISYFIDFEIEVDEVDYLHMMDVHDVDPDTQFSGNDMSKLRCKKGGTSPQQ